MNEIINNCRGSCGEGLSVNMVIGDIALVLAEAINRENDAGGIPNGYRAILFHLAGNNGISQLELARLVGIKPPTVSVSLQKMEADGFVTRKTDSDDQRRTIVSLTEKGRETAMAMFAVFSKYDAMLDGALSEEETEQLRTLLLKVRERVVDKSSEKAST